MAVMDPKGLPLMNSNIREDNSLARQLFQYIFGLYCLIAITVTIIQITEEYRYTQKSIEQELTTYQKIFGPVLAKALWDLDRDQINTITKGLTEVPIIVGVKIERLQGDKLIPYSGRNASQFELSTYEQFSYSFPVEYSTVGNTHPLGKATLYSDSSIVLDRVKLGFTFLIINALIKGIALWIIFWWISNRFLIKPLNRLIEAITSVRFDNLENFRIDLKIKKNNELTLIEHNFSKMVNELITAKKDVTEFNKKLEFNVQQRTLELRKAKDEAEQATASAEKSAEAKSEFLSIMSHELRTPMNGIQGMLYLLEQSSVNDKQQKYIETATYSANQLLNLIADILDISKLESGDLSLEYSEFELQPVLNEVFKNQKLKNTNNQIELIFESDDIKGIHVLADSNRLKQILNNLIANAIKFTPQGTVEINIKKKNIVANNTHKTRLIITVADTGIGISDNKVEQLFNTFSLVDSSSTREYAGTGLGLTICEKLCHLMDGSISVQSKLGKGSTFRFEVLLHTLD